MPSSAQLKLIEDVLNLPSLKVIDYTTQENVGIIIQVLAQHQKVICPRCGTKSEKLQRTSHGGEVSSPPVSSSKPYLFSKRFALR